jgi:dTMP kinase
VDAVPAPALRQPDVTVWFDIDPAIAAQRLAGARVPDKFESQPQAFFARVASGYAARAAADPGRFLRVQADQSREAVWRDLQSGLRARGVLA